MVKKKIKDSMITTKKGKNVPTRDATAAVPWNPFNMLDEASRLFMNEDPWTSPLLRHWAWRRPWAGLWLGPDMKEVPIDMIDKGKE